jgi:hypothetical protein
MDCAVGQEISLNHLLDEKTDGLLAQAIGNQTQFRRASAEGRHIPADQ